MSESSAATPGPPKAAVTTASTAGTSRGSSCRTAQTVSAASGCARRAIARRPYPVPRARSASQDLAHRLALGELVDQLVQVTDVAHQGVLDLLDADAADRPGDQRRIRVELRVGEELLEGGAGGQV